MPEMAPDAPTVGSGEAGADTLTDQGAGNNNPSPTYAAVCTGSAARASSVTNLGQGLGFGALCCIEWSSFAGAYRNDRSTNS